MLKTRKTECTNCRLCMLACTAAHEPGLHSSKFSRVHIEDAWPEIGAIHVCVSCTKQFCIKACPSEALSWDGHVVLDRDKCTDCGACFEACPFGGVRRHPTDGYPMVCDTCDGRYSCIKACPTGAISRR
ncbi:4Fe-4S dicluster domain-containing protein [Desulfovibrio sp. Fe33]|uniref:4Fe-4S dicluster domain-containing protein n=1 Tax=Desulfovibrio sp. Fe33 TaxID=3020842 RepID=UPI00234C4997|nr:4Fe-4S dicluster domain-containing protein [Desulfovibrio sp. Fe33]